MVMIYDDTDAAQVLAPYLLNGKTPDPGDLNPGDFIHVKSDTGGGWGMVAAMIVAGLDAVTILKGMHPDQRQLIMSIDPDADPSAVLEANLAARWDVLNAGTLMQPARPPVYLIDGMIRRPSMTCVYGAPGALKSFLLMDLAVCVAAGIPWLPALPSTGEGGSYRLNAGPILWVDQDNGQNRLQERFGALCRARQITDPSLPLHAITLPSPPFSIAGPHDRDLLLAQIGQLGAVACFIDNLGTVSGGAEENSSDMVMPMANLRYVAEKSGAAVFVVHHARKGGANGGRAGDALRGHSSIEASLDLALLVERDHNTVKIQSTKTRDDPVAPFEALWTYETNQHRALDWGRFWHLRQVERKVSDHDRIAQDLAELVAELPQPLNHSALIKAIKETRDVGPTTARSAIEAAEKAGTIASRKLGDKRNSPRLFFLPGDEDKPQRPVQGYTGPAMWQNADHDEPVMVTGFMGHDAHDGQDYFTVEGGQTGIPADQLMVEAAGE